jgi:uncharacterized protein (DUF1800 family)
MRIRVFALRKCFASALCAGVAALLCGSSSAAPSLAPSLFSVSSASTRAVVLESVSMRSEPFTLNGAANFSPADPRTRITVFCMNLDFLQGEGANALTADAEDAAHTIYPLKVEYVGTVPSFDGVYMVVLRLNDLMASNLGDVLIRLNLHGMASNRVRVGIGVIGGGPADDSAPNPAPATPPGAASPLTLAAYQQIAGAPAAVAGSDGIRFLEQATWGPTDTDLAHVRAVGISQYLTEQFNTAPQFTITKPVTGGQLLSDYPLQNLYPVSSTTGCPTGSPATCGRDNYTMYLLQTQMVKNTLSAPDQLRQRVAFALHQFIVVGGNGINNEASWEAPYLQTLDNDAFGNFQNILMDVTLDPGMGDYLDMLNNSRAAPNENYAREIMQLFSIGVDRLNADGTPILDAQGNRLPSYDQNDITSLARVFTGWTLNSNQTWVVDGTTSVPNYLDPMRLNTTSSNSYDLNQKVFTTLNGGFTMPACSNCTNNLANSQAYKQAELNQVIGVLFNHPNTGPYVCTQLIHQMVTSNPSPAYVGRCAAAFNGNRSNPAQMQEVVKAILLDPEARGDVKTDPNYGHLREPILLAGNMLRWFNGTTDGNLSSLTSFAASTNSRDGWLLTMGQDIFNPPTVFSYYPADYALPGAPLLGPEFGVMNSQTAFIRPDFINALFLSNSGNGLPVANPDRPTGTQFNISAYTGLTAQQLVDTLDTKLMHNTTSTSMKNSILSNLNNISDGTLRARTAIYLFATSSQFQVER